MTARSGAAFAGVLLVTLLGLLGSHGVHGTHGTGTGHATVTAHPGVHALETDGAATAGGTDRSATPLVAAGCLAILAGLGFAMWALRRRYSRDPVGIVRSTYALRFAPWTGRGPPTLAELSILRC